MGLRLTGAETDVAALKEQVTKQEAAFEALTTLLTTQVKSVYETTRAFAGHQLQALKVGKGGAC